MNKKVLMIAFHFPPDASIGAQRTLKTAEYLPQFGWDPIILTAKSYAYDSIESTQVIPQSLNSRVYRTAALNVQRHLSIRGYHFEWMQVIDRWTTWIPAAILKGRKIIKTNKPDVIWSTSPIPSAHVIASYLANSFQIPWVADYRDPLRHHQTPTSALRKRLLTAIDEMTIRNSASMVFTTTKAMQLYDEKFIDLSPKKLFTVENGYDEQNWQQLTNHKPASDNPISDDKFSLFYSGTLYSNGRDPKPLFEAIRILKSEKTINACNFELIFQGTEVDDQYKDLLSQMGIAELVKFSPKVPYLDSLYFLNKATALVLIQDEVFNFQVPGKLYEYMRTGSPILTVTPKNSATDYVSRRYPLAVTAQTAFEIADALKNWVTLLPGRLDHKELQRFSREVKSKEIAEILDKSACIANE